MAKRKQPNSQMCFICGIQNPIGLKLCFYEQEDESITAEFTARDEHQGYPGVLHGGIACALLDEIIGRASLAAGREQWMLTARLELRYAKVVPIGLPLTIVGRIEKFSRHGMTGRGEIRLSDGTLAVEATGLYVALPPAQRETVRAVLPMWQVVED